MHGLHHIHKRKRYYQNLEPYPHPKKWINNLDKFLIIVAFIAPLTTLPQIFNIIISKQAGSISALTWSLYAIFNIPWVFYGFVHKEKPIIIMHILWLIMN